MTPADITDRIIICGLPSSGVEALYRNDRSTLRHFLQSRYGTKYRIFNFCPRFENGYDAAYFNHQVSRFPFPDHHPPPLSMIPLVTRAMQQWMEADDDNVIVIHCKAGKGRSGTMCCCYLLSLPTLPKPPQLSHNYSKGSKRPERLLAVNEESSLPSPVGQDSESDSADEVGNGRSDRVSRAQSGGAALDLAGKRGTDRHNKGRERITQLVENLASSGDEAGIGHPDDRDDESSEASDGEQDQAADKEMRGMADKLQQIFDLHTAQRMKPQKPASASSPAGQAAADSPVTASPTSSKAPFKYPKKPVRGVSIPSQRRFVSYWSRVLTKADPRPLDLLAPPNPSRLERVRREVCITEVRIYMPSRMPGFPALISGKRVSVHLGRYKTSFVDGLEKRELALREERRLEKMLRRQPDRMTKEEQEKLRSLQKSNAEWKDDEAWDDRSKMFEGEGSLVERSEASSTGDPLDGDADSDAQDVSSSVLARDSPHSLLTSNNRARRTSLSGDFCRSPLLRRKEVCKSTRTGKCS